MERKVPDDTLKGGESGLRLRPCKNLCLTWKMKLVRSRLTEHPSTPKPYVYRHVWENPTMVAFPDPYPTFHSWNTIEPVYILVYRRFQKMLLVVTTSRGVLRLVLSLRPPGLSIRAMWSGAWFSDGLLPFELPTRFRGQTSWKITFTSFVDHYYKEPTP